MKITDLDLLAGNVNRADLISIVNKSDTTQAASGSTRKLPLSNLPSAFNFRRVAAILPSNGSSTTNLGTAATSSGGGVSHVASSSNGLMANYAGLSFAGVDAGVRFTDATFHRGAAAGVNGFNFRARVLCPDASYDESGASTGSRIGVGLVADTIANTLASDDTSVEKIMFRRFSVNGGVADTNWQLITKGAGVQTVTDTGIAFAVNKIYDFYLDAASAVSSVDWLIHNLTDDLVASGNIALTLPQAATALRGMLGVLTIDAVTRNIRMGALITETAL